MPITHEDQHDYEREIEFQIGRGYMVLPMVISDLVLEADIWNEDGNVKDYETRWISAKVEIKAPRSQTVIWSGIVSGAEVNVGNNLADATISDALDEIAEEAFLRDYRAGEIV